MLLATAPKRQFRVIGKDDPHDSGWKKGDYPRLSEAREAAKSNGHRFVSFHIFNDQGEEISVPNDVS